MKEIRIDVPLKINLDPLVLCLGNFDGVHLGHQTLINKAIQEAKINKYQSAFFTFSISPKKMFSKNRYSELTSINDRKEIVSKMGVDQFIVFDFNDKTMNLSPEEFIEEVIIKLNTKIIICGFDYTFGKFGKGTVDDLIKLSKNRYKVIKIDSIEYLSEKISTTRIINEIEDGNIKTANYLLGRNYFINGRVQKGFQNGKKLGFPTANIENGDYLLPKNGVYLVKIIRNNHEYKGICNVGVHPSISKLSKPVIETHIFNFNENIYGEIIKIEFLEFIREEKEFSSIDDLKKQLELDTFSNY